MVTQPRLARPRYITPHSLLLDVIMRSWSTYITSDNCSPMIWISLGTCN